LGTLHEDSHSTIHAQGRASHALPVGNNDLGCVARRLRHSFLLSAGRLRLRGTPSAGKNLQVNADFISQHRKATAPQLDAISLLADYQFQNHVSAKYIANFQ
jgi:hypothetical protein